MKTTAETDIIGEIHRIREAMAAKHGNDIKALFADVIARQEQHDSRLVKPPEKQQRTGNI